MNKQTNLRPYVRLLIVVGFLVVVGLFALTPDHKQTPVAAAAEPPKLTATSSFTVTSPASVRVYGKVHNDGTTAYAPSCTVYAHDSAGAYSGLDVISDNNKIQPDGVWNFAFDLTISGQGADSVTAADVTCK